MVECSAVDVCLLGLSQLTGSTRAARGRDTVVDTLPKLSVGCLASQNSLKWWPHCSEVAPAPSLARWCSGSWMVH